MILNSDVRGSKNNMFQMPTDMVGIFFGNIEFCNKTCMILMETKGLSLSLTEKRKICIIYKLI